MKAAAAVIFDPDGRLLLIRENYDRRRYSFPGGAVEPHESPEDAAVRETLEETGVIVAIDRLVGRYRLAGGLDIHLFACRHVAGEPAVPSTGEIAEVGWYAPDAIPHPVSNVLHHALPDVVDGARNVVRENLPRLN